MMKKFLSNFGPSSASSANNLIAKLRGPSFDPVMKGAVSPMMRVPNTVAYPEYANSGIPRNSPRSIITYSPEQIKHIRKSARLARKMLEFALSLAKPGVTTDAIDIATFHEIVKHGAYPSPINYRGFPKAICTSPNEVVCHGIPDSRPLQEGDVLSIDVSLYLNGYHGDNCGTCIVGKPIDKSSLNLVDTARTALMNGIATCRPGSCLSEIGAAIEKTAHQNGLVVVKDFYGHGTGPILHMSPLVAHFENKDLLTLRPGMVFTIEPVIAEGSGKLLTWDDGWSAVTEDGGRGAQFEHEVLITEDGHEILTVVE